MTRSPSEKAPARDVPRAASRGALTIETILEGMVNGLSGNAEVRHRAPHELERVQGAVDVIVHELHVIRTKLGTESPAAETPRGRGK